jgi:hypothetical protein
MITRQRALPIYPDNKKQALEGQTTQRRTKQVIRQGHFVMAIKAGQKSPRRDTDEEVNFFGEPLSRELQLIKRDSTCSR